jgi:hypothetical protein
MAQNVRVEGTFLDDSITIGVPTPYLLKAVYPKNDQVLYPDSTFDFTPFELFEKAYFNSVLRDSMIVDSVVYYLTSFEIEPVQYNQLPVFQISGADSIIYLPEKDSVFLKEMVPVVYDSLELIENTALIELPLQFNYQYALILTGGILLVLILIGVFFGKAILRSIKRYRMEKRHLRFIATFNGHIHDIRNENRPEALERSLSFWKSYMEKLDEQPYTKLTSKELKDLVVQEHIYLALKEIDRCIYGGRRENEIYKQLEDLEYFANETFQQKIRDLNHG